MFPTAKILLFGSSAAYLAVLGSDIDVLVYDQSEKLPALFNQSFEKLTKVNRFKNVEKIICNVPIIKLQDKKSGIYADITFNREDCYKGVITALTL